jgi:HAD superfamily hydrolase (TIGR01450 family)
VGPEAAGLPEAAVSAAVGNIVCDLDGVVYLSQTGIPGAGEALSALERRGYHIVFATNAPIRTARQVAAHIEQVSGYPARRRQVVTSAMALIGMLGPEDSPLLVVGEEGLAATLREAGFDLSQDPTSVRTVVVGLDRHLTYERLRRATTAVLGGARLLAGNRDATYPSEQGLLPGGGAIVAAIEAASERRAEVAGKPFPPMRAEIRKTLGPGPTWVVGDRPETDLQLGRDEGWSTVLVLTGVISDPAAVPPELQPDLVLPSLAALPARLP